MPLQLYFYKIAVLIDGEWHCYRGYVFATTKNSAIAILNKRYLDGVVRKPFGDDIPPGEDVRVWSIERILVEEGTCL